MKMPTIKLSPQVERELKELAKIQGVRVSEYVRVIIHEKLEDMFDLQVFNDALDEYKKDSTTYTLDEAEKELGL